ncbi:MAG: tetratricopeptide repeat protein [Calditrichaeota bacterium]|nr:MAG: tetratricopeptide repeat protein [Calditrichota bacterium]MBL1203812.1 tetratricopeptide repeat protein [Calditrichota bacterium]NOG43642.1 tetratricopeptide repeat protein [Calditrichota bacterium]
MFFSKIRQLFTLLILVPIITNAQSLREKVNKGNEHYSQSEYELAINKYKDALLDDPLNERILFNEADALYKMEKYDEALEGFQKILGSKDLNLASQAHFNIGNVHFKQEKLTESIYAYKKALELNSSDYDAKYNLELARAKLKEQSEKQEQKNDEKQENIEPSDYAKKIKEQAEALASQGLFKQALSLMNRELKNDPTIAAFKKFSERLQNVVDIDEGV